MKKRLFRLPAVVGTAVASAWLTVHTVLPAGQPEHSSSTENIQLVQQPGGAAPAAPAGPGVTPPVASPDQPATQPAASAPSAPSGASVASALAGGILGQSGGSPAQGGGAPNPASTSGGGAAALSASQQSAPTTSSSVVGGGESVGRAASDLGDLLGKSINALGVEVHHRSPIISDPVIRGYHLGQYITQVDGGFWFPARMDLDTIVSKIDASQIENVVIIKGPYSVRYGPGFSFLDVETLSTPRYEGGYQVHTMSGVTYKNNGAQLFGVESVYGGNDNSGFRVTYTIGTGTDYWDGAGVRQPSGFNSQTWNAAYGFNVGQYGKVELKGMHVEQHNVKIPGAFFDLSFLKTESFTGRYVFDDREYTKFTLDSWFNYTKLTGNNFLPSKRQQNPEIDNLNGFPNAPTPNSFFIRQDFATTNSQLASWGYRGAFTLGAPRALQVTVGTDLRCLDSQLNEFDFFNSFIPGGTPVTVATNFPVPHAVSYNPGVFLDLSLPLLEDRFTIKAGIRYDHARTSITRYQSPLPSVPTTNGVGALQPTRPFAYAPAITAPLTGAELTREYQLFSAFITPEWKLNDNYTLVAGVGYAQRPPTMTELYALQPFLGVVQRGLNFVEGNPFLAPEKLWQADAGLKVNYDRFRLGVNGFCSWVHNYITYQNFASGFAVNQAGTPLDFGLQYANTDLAILAGGEYYTEWDANRWLTLFGTAAYVAGRDESVDGRRFANLAVNSGIPTLVGPVSEALPNIPPLDTHVGFRIHDPGEARRWAIEFNTRIVAAQNQVATTLGEVTTPGFTVYDVRGYWQANRNVLLTAGIENIGNKQYREWADLRTAFGVFQPGFNAYVGARLTY